VVVAASSLLAQPTRAAQKSAEEIANLKDESVFILSACFGRGGSVGASASPLSLIVRVPQHPLNAGEKRRTGAIVHPATVKDLGKHG
jgi:hypothetical protein